MSTIKIIVTKEKLFNLNNKYYSEFYINHVCAAGHFSIIRNDIVIEKGYISWTGTHGASPMFVFSNPTRYCTSLKSKDLEIGDILELDLSIIGIK